LLFTGAAAGGSALGQSFTIASVVIIIFSVIVASASVGYRVIKHPGGKGKCCDDGCCGDDGGEGGGDGGANKPEKAWWWRLTRAQRWSVLAVSFAAPLLLASAGLNIAHLLEDHDHGKDDEHHEHDEPEKQKWIEPLLMTTGLVLLLTSSFLTANLHLKVRRWWRRWRNNTGDETGLGKNIESSSDVESSTTKSSIDEDQISSSRASSDSESDSVQSSSA
jgi:hypothetical protein